MFHHALWQSQRHWGTAAAYLCLKSQPNPAGSVFLSLQGNKERTANQGTSQTLHVSRLASLRLVLACWLCPCDSDIPLAAPLPQPLGSEWGRRRALVRENERRSWWSALGSNLRPSSARVWVTVFSVATFQFPWPSFPLNEQSFFVSACGMAANRSFVRV